MKKPKRRLVFVLLGVLPMLAACSSTCHCPTCPNTTVITPQGASSPNTGTQFYDR